MRRSALIALLLMAGVHHHAGAGPLEYVTDRIRGEGHEFRPERVEVDEERVRSLKVPAGFTVNVFARELGQPRMLAVDPQGDVYVTRPHEGDVLVLTDRDGDGKAEGSRVLLSGMPGVHGIALAGDRIYLGFPTEIKAAQLGKKLTAWKTILSGLATGGHDDRTLALGPDGRLYVSVGSTCNDCEEKSAESATIVRLKPDGGAKKIFARGLRNTIGFDWHPQTGQLWGMDHGIDWLGDDIPPEELNLLVEDRDYGWPYFWANKQVNPRLEAPKDRRSSVAPALGYQAHAAPIGFVFYAGSGFPAEYKGDAFVAMHGSWNRKPAVGYKVVRVKFASGRPVAFQDFLSGFLTDDGEGQFGRPAGLAVAKDGALLVSDDSNGMIYRVAAKR
jgi:glucose/arabinose dehydrogenase